MNNKKIILSLFTSIIFLSSCLGATEKSNEITQVAQEEVNYEENILNTYRNINLKYRETESFTTCIESNVNSCYQRQVKSTAREAEDVLICNDLEDETIRTECKEAIISLKARSEKDIEGCNQIEGSEQVNCKYGIIFEEAIEKKDIRICEEIAPGNNETDEETQKSYQDSITNCKQNIYTSIAISDLDAKSCYKITKKDIRDSCIEQVNNFIDFNKDKEEIVRENYEAVTFTGSNTD